MSKPTPLSPWFVVMKIADGDRQVDTGEFFQWYTEADGEQGWSLDRTRARLFNSLGTAYKVALASGAYVIALATEEALKEFRPKGL